ncbi:hypothetical protein SVIOM74S_07938 [Streptomyces violarus]
MISGGGVAAVLALVKDFSDVAPYSWFIGTALAAGLYAVLCRSERAAVRVAWSSEGRSDRRQWNTSRR